MELLKYIIDFLVILLAVGAWEVVYDRYKTYKNKDIQDLMCAACKKPRVTKKTKDKKYWMCRKCKKLYEEEVL